MRSQYCHSMRVLRWGAVLVLAACHAYDEGLLASKHSQRGDAARGGKREHEADGGERGDASASPDASAPRDAGEGDDAGSAPSDAAGAGAAGSGAAGSAQPAAGSGGTAGQASGAGSAGNAGMSSGANAGAPGPAPVACTEANARVFRDNGHCYIPLSVASSWYVSRDRCRELGAHLVVISSPVEQTFVATVVGSVTRWTGLSRFGAPAFSWVNDEPVTFENWESGAPKLNGEAAAALRTDSYLWFDAAVTESYAPLCEREQ